MSVRPSGAHGWSSLPEPVRHSILGALSLMDASQIGATSMDNYRSFKSQLQQRIISLLDMFALDPSKVLAVLKSTGSVISGSAALWVVFPGRFRPGDLDFYVATPGVDELRSLLLSQSYQEVPGPGMLSPIASRYDSPSLSAIREVTYFRHPHLETTLNVIETTSRCSVAAVYQFHTTLVMNYITWNAFISSYPLMVSDECGVLNTADDILAPRFLDCLLKYRDRGFRFVRTANSWSPRHTCGADFYCEHTIRGVNDPATMRLTFSSDPFHVPDTAAPYINWRLSSRFSCTRRAYRPSVGWVYDGSRFEPNYTNLDISDEEDL